MSKVDQLRALREAAATAASFPIKEVTARQVVETALARIPAAASVPASTTYQYRDPDKRRAYMREYAKKRRALKAAEREAAKEQG